MKKSTIFRGLAMSILLVFVIQLWGQNKCEFEEIPPNDSIGDYCTTAIKLCGAVLNGYQGILEAEIHPGNQPFPLCPNGENFQADNITWFEFVPCQENVMLEIIPMNCENIIFPNQLGLQAGIYSSCAFSEVVDCQSEGQIGPIILEGVVIPGEPYYLFVDGFQGSVCEYEIHVIEGVETSPFTFEADGEFYVTGNEVSCVGNIGEYYVDGACNISASGSSCGFGVQTLEELPDDYICYEWTIIPETGWEIIGDHNGPTIQVKWLLAGTYVIDRSVVVNPYFDSMNFGCFVGDVCPQNPLTVVVPPWNVITETVELCPGESIDFCGQTISEEGSYNCPDFMNCINEVLVVYIKSDSILINEEYYLCPGECVNFEGVDYCEPGEYFIESQLYCNSYYQFYIESLIIDITISGNTTLDCTDTPVILTVDVGNYNPADFIINWYTGGTWLAGGNQISVYVAGNYLVELIYLGANGNTTCVFSQSIDVIEDFDSPEISIIGENFSCSQSTVVLGVQTLDNIKDYYWTGPNGFQSNMINPSITEPGWYQLVVIGQNGCYAESAIEIFGTSEQAELSIEYGHLNCAVSATMISFQSNVAIQSVEWKTPSGKILYEMNPLVDEVGIYTCTIVSETGCKYTEYFEILGDFVVPTVMLDPSDLWECNTEQMPIYISYNSASNKTYQWSTTNGVIFSGIDSEILVVGNSGTYQVTVTDLDNGCTQVENIDILSNTDVPVSMDLEAHSPKCFGEELGTIELLEVTGGKAPYAFYVNGDLVEKQWVEKRKGDYDVQIIDANGCRLEDKVEIEEANGLEGEMEGPHEGDYNDRVSFYSIVDFATYDIDVINWYNKSNIMIGNGEKVAFNLIEDEMITMEIIDINGCIIVRSAPIILNRDIDVYTPNVFSPNGDGSNEHFTLFTGNIPVDHCSLEIFDRWGNKVYDNQDLKLNDPSTGWNGQHHGKAVLSGVYAYVAKLDVFGEEKQLTGTVSVVK